MVLTYFSPVPSIVLFTKLSADVFKVPQEVIRILSLWFFFPSLLCGPSAPSPSHHQHQPECWHPQVHMGPSAQLQATLL